MHVRTASSTEYASALPDLLCLSEQDLNISSVGLFREDRDSWYSLIQTFLSH